ncbi:hypothetical protein UFOVP1336_26 [uncultured Caudovirales phage]|uniref:Uncharacterized protein n=1 Tax=uncultured Caudovirales phage TaxID=2100421 RepID=A0A6J5RZW8_9CAUD|nr:hypothetical protein UFOVP1336_26 [uncultured Caudovirales phage]
MSKDENKAAPVVSPEAPAAPVKSEAGLEPGEIVLSERKDGDSVIVVTSFGRKIVKKLK